jgi:hypothetical protein
MRLYVSISIVIRKITLRNRDIEAYEVIWIRLWTHPTPPSIRGRQERDGHLCSMLTATEWTLVPCGEHIARHVEKGSAGVKRNNSV